MARLTALLLSLCAAGCSCSNPLSEMITDDIHESLTHAARCGDVQAIELIAAKGVDLDQPYAHEETGWTPLQYAVRKGQAESVRVLLEWGADPDATQGSNNTPLGMAAEAGNQTIVTLLVNAGATPTDAFAKTPATPAPSRP